VNKGGGSSGPEWDLDGMQTRPVESWSEGRVIFQWVIHRVWLLARALM